MLFRDLEADEEGMLQHDTYAKEANNYIVFKWFTKSKIMPKKIMSEGIRVHRNFQFFAN